MLKHLRIASLVVFGLVLAASAGAQNYAASIDGLQEVPPNASPGFGSGSFVLDAAKVLSYNISFSGLVASETASHIHGPASPGVNAGVLFPLPLGSPKIGATPALTATQEGWLNSGLLYVNIHSSTFPGGEIRGQISRATPTREGTWGRIKNQFK